MDKEIDKTSMKKMEGMTKEIKRQMCLAKPLTVANFLMFALQVVSIMLVGHISHEKFAGASIAISFVNSLGFSVLMRASSAVDTLCGQSFGAQNYKMVGIYLQRAMVICVLICIPLAFGTAFSGSILILLRQCILKFLQAQKIVVPIMFSSGITAIFHFINCWFFTYKTGLGYRGAALSVSISYWFNLLLLVLYLSKLQFELLLLLAGLLTNPALQTALMSIPQNISSLVYALPQQQRRLILKFLNFFSTRISNELGAKNPKAAMIAILVATLTIISEGLIVGLAMIGGWSLWGHAYTKERDVVNAVAVKIPWISLSYCIDGFQCVLLGI
ncbi:hypothetical protein IEQ34_017658 [Dendrobium chrysotoxum]|uniref:Uncharacterized protein n=1 Tax=Dendrobium chrysotoxum TaxID=161865 RepID=A0AAV7GC69_DENCH|nr:hypothetical protein IEQ34_017658 [Dendrobium chrysotoxum]